MIYIDIFTIELLLSLHDRREAHDASKGRWNPSQKGLYEGVVIVYERTESGKGPLRVQ